MNWYHNAYRKLFLDYHSQQNITEVGQNFNAEEWAESLREAKVEAVSCIATCHYGWSYYRKGTIRNVHPHLPENMDMLEETISACHRRGIKVLAYVYTFCSEKLTREKPTLSARNYDGTLRQYERCLISGDSLEQELLPLLKELVQNYDIDALFLDGTYYHNNPCHCDSCKTAFRMSTRYDVPVSDEDKHAKEYVKWVKKQYEHVRQRCLETVKEEKPDLPVCFNTVYATRDPEDIPTEIGFVTEDAPPSNMLQILSSDARLWALTRKDFDVMNHMSLRWWQEWSVKTPETLKQEAAIVLANGGRTWIGYQHYPQYGISKAALDTLKKVFSWVEKREQIVKESKAMPYIGFLHTQEHTESPLSGFVDQDSLMGAHMAFSRSGIPYNSITEQILLENLERFKLIIIANDQHVSKHCTQKLNEYVINGGKLLITGESCNDSDIICSMSGVRAYAHMSDGYGYIQCTDRLSFEDIPEQPILCPGAFSYGHISECTVVAAHILPYRRSDGQSLYTTYTDKDTFSPPGKTSGLAAITKKNYGLGVVMWIGCDIFKAYYGSNSWILRRFIKHIINDELLKEDAVRIDAPDYVEVALSKKNDADIIHLVNISKEAPAVDMHMVVEYLIGEEPIPIHDIVINFPARNNPKSVRDVFADNELVWDYDGRNIKISIPVLKIWAAIAITY